MTAVNTSLESARAGDADRGLLHMCRRLLDLLNSEAKALSEADVARVSRLSEEKNTLLAELRGELERRPISQVDPTLESVLRDCRHQNAVNGVTLSMTRNNHLALLRTLRNEDAAPVYAPSGQEERAQSRSLGSA